MSMWRRGDRVETVIGGRIGRVEAVGTRYVRVRLSRAYCGPWDHGLRWIEPHLLMRPEESSPRRVLHTMERRRRR